MLSLVYGLGSLDLQCDAACVFSKAHFPTYFLNSSVFPTHFLTYQLLEATIAMAGNSGTRESMWYQRSISEHLFYHLSDLSSPCPLVPP